ncbi:MAG: hypothetical protein J2P37_18185, partial [Ktedonobacteraceae bacterium]|nr:hypothetical protein [Ktedonobacteraceae bacterium]
MKQGNGMDLLGPNEPRGTEVGIIYVSPTDDRQSVLAAIITQEKLGRKQVAIVLPKQNKAFDQPQDFDDLKGFRRKLRTQLVFIVPGGPGPADLARQRRFDVYSSLENYASALRQEFQESAQPRRSWLFGSPRFKSSPARNAENGHEAPDQLATPTSSRRTATATPAGNGTPPPASGRSSTAVATPNTRNAALAGALDAGMLAANLEHGSDKSPTNENSGPSENHPGQSPTTPPGNVRPPLADGQDDAAQKSAQPSDARELPDDYDFYETSLDDSRA